jgi:hypothetical protein
MNLKNQGAQVFGVDMNGILDINSTIRHIGDTDTSITFSDDVVTFLAGGVALLTLSEGATDEVIINNGGLAANLRVESDNEDYMLFTDGTNDTVGIAMQSASADSAVAMHIEGSSNAKGFRNDNPPRAKMYLNVAQTNLTKNVWTKVELDVDDYDTDNITDTTNHKITPGIAGYYLCIGNCTWTGGFAAGNRMSMYLKKNGSNIMCTDQGIAGGTQYLTNHIATVEYLDADDYIEMFARPGTAGDTADISTGDTNTYMLVHRLS